MKKITTWVTALAVVSALAACDSDDPEKTVSLEITAEFPSMVSDNATNSLHFWVLEPLPAPDESVEMVTCGQLRLRDKDPYDVRVTRQADWVNLRADDGDTYAADIAGGNVLVYVEGVDFSGSVIMNGCVAQEVSGDGSVTVTLSTAETLDCDDPEAENGTPCDDGMFCTVGETCEGGSCGGGRDRDCSHLADDCNAEQCDESQGCFSTPKSENTPCDDGQYCTENDACDGEGECIAGPARDCAATLMVDADCYLGSCNEFSDVCEPSFATFGTTCDADMSSCTPMDTCDSFGNCDVDFEDCSSLDDTATCMLGQCNTGGDACEATLPATGTGHLSCNSALEVTCGPDPSDSVPACDPTYPGECVGGTVTGADDCSNLDWDDDCDGSIDEDAAPCA